MISHSSESLLNSNDALVCCIIGVSLSSGSSNSPDSPPHILL